MSSATSDLILLSVEASYCVRVLLRLFMRDQSQTSRLHVGRLQQGTLYELFTVCGKYMTNGC